ncbi:MAG: hypothetical protein EP344_04640 [Bacteroidetes bacterium]|nr:MAG: hypothetical protein EP344_04640 [Bacteroidota bacterium]
MKTLFHICTLILLPFALTAQLSVTVVPNKLSYGGSGITDANGNPLRGDNYVLDGYIYAGDYLETNCPTALNCGIDAGGGAANPGSVIGKWRFRGFSVLNLAEALQNGGAPTFSNQLFEFNSDFAECPGCKISLDGQDFYGGAENTPFKKAIIGATTEEYRSKSGEAEITILKQPENENATGSYNMKVTFFFDK